MATGKESTVLAVVVVDINGEMAIFPLVAPLDLVLIDVLAQLQLSVRRLGGSLRLREVSVELSGLLDLVGLLDRFDLVGDEDEDGSGVETRRQAERGEELGIEEVVDRRDPTV